MASHKTCGSFDKTSLHRTLRAAHGLLVRSVLPVVRHMPVHVADRSALAVARMPPLHLPPGIRRHTRSLPAQRYLLFVCAVARVHVSITALDTGSYALLAGGLPWWGPRVPPHLLLQEADAAPAANELLEEAPAAEAAAPPAPQVVIQAAPSAAPAQSVVDMATNMATAAAPRPASSAPHQACFGFSIQSASGLWNNAACCRQEVLLYDRRLQTSFSESIMTGRAWVASIWFAH